MNQPAKRFDLRTEMPDAAEWVDAQRRELGREHVNECIRRALAGEPGFFYCFEAGHILGTPFSSTSPVRQDMDYAVLHGCRFAGFIRRTPIRPNEGKNTDAN